VQGTKDKDMALTLITAPAKEPVELGKLKDHLRVDVSDDDTMIRGYLATVRRHIEYEILQRALITQTWDLYLDSFPGLDELNLPRPPLQSVTHIKYYDADDSESTVSSDDYVVDIYSTPSRVKLKSGSSWPGDTLRVVNGVVVRYVAGYGDNPADVPEEIRQAIMLLVGDMYENRENTLIGVPGSLQVLPFAAESLLFAKRAKVGGY